MKTSVYQKLEALVERFEEVQALLSDPDTIADQEKFKALSKEFSQLEEVTKVFHKYQEAENDLETAEMMLKDDDPDMREMAQDEFKEAKQAVEDLTQELQILLLPKDPNDDNNCFVEIRAGAGGDGRPRGRRVGPRRSESRARRRTPHRRGPAGSPLRPAQLDRRRRHGRHNTNRLCVLDQSFLRNLLNDTDGFNP